MARTKTKSQPYTPTKEELENIAAYEREKRDNPDTHRVISRHPDAMRIPLMSEGPWPPEYLKKYAELEEKHKDEKITKVFASAERVMQEGNRLQNIIRAWIDSCLPLSPRCASCDDRFTLRAFASGSRLPKPHFFTIMCRPLPIGTVEVKGICAKCAANYHRMHEYAPLRLEALGRSAPHCAEVLQ